MLTLLLSEGINHYTTPKWILDGTNVKPGSIAPTLLFHHLGVSHLLYLQTVCVRECV